MNYDLAKKLKDAGFPQEVRLGDLYFGQNKPFIPHIFHTKSYKPKPIWVKIPTLSELIEACGNIFNVLQLSDSGFWQCGSYCEGEFTEDSRGDTPEEAVANLWLTLKIAIT